MNSSSCSFLISGLFNKVLLVLILLIGFIPSSDSQNCTIEEISNNFENAFGDVTDIEVADDIVISENQNFILEKFTFNLWLRDTATVSLDMVNLRFYESDGEFPGMLLGEFFSKPAKDSILGNLNFGNDETYNVHQITVEIDTLVKFEGQSDGRTTYWIGLLTPNAPSKAYYESTNASFSQTLSCFFLNGTWRNSYAGGSNFLDAGCVFKAEGQCEELISSVENTNLDSSVLVFPNPTNRIVNIEISSDLVVEHISLYDKLGKISGVSFINNQFDISGLPKGVYLARIVTSGRTVFKRILKQ